MWPIRSLDPPLQALTTCNPRETSFMRYFDGARDRGDGCWTPLEAASPQLIAAVVKAEDRGFFTHHGADWESIQRMLRVAIRARRVVGGASTITQQLARNLYLTPTRSIVRKLRELALALRIERILSKARILELYLNLIEWGPHLWGCAAASEHYFQQKPRDLALFESTFLACLIAAPKAPVSGRNAARMQNAQLWLAYRMFLAGLADGDECAVCCHRVWHLQRLLAAGVPLPAALSASIDVDAGETRALLREVASALDIRPLDVRSLLTSQCGEDQQQRALDRLIACIGEDVLLQILRTHNYAGLRDRLPSLSAAPANRI